MLMLSTSEPATSLLENLLDNFRNPDFLKWFRGEFQITALPETILSCSLETIPGHHSSWLGYLDIQSSTAKPLRLVLKLRPVEQGYAEVLFHQIWQSSASNTVAPVYAAGLLTDFDCCFLLMPDNTETHHLPCDINDTFTGFQPDKDLQHAIIKTLAEFHNEAAELLKDEELKEQITGLGFGRYRDHTLPLLESITYSSYLVNSFPDDLLSPSHKHQIKERLLDAVYFWNATLRPRFKYFKNITISHSDCLLHHFWLPDDKSQRPQLFDFDQATIHSPVWDLVTLLSTGNFTDIDASLDGYREHSFLKYSEDELREEFEALALCQIYTVLAERERGAGELLWRTRLVRLLRLVSLH
ncbi:hypothetical protein [Parendozoicomonas haliclonae]|uniref:Phosphotransferase enzyme family protein n=1 Tax=Parendozoicomonas haliclonae TaxID=1960125 RepID=A0A1X7ALK9_9GAMM|nr:hypothetical protein [Parendozoicomonas haliclonae]SMA48538.1 hypothetical protein EHSB41UT_02784 [Parendozoicomonas haliclonae]